MHTGSGPSTATAQSIRRIVRESEEIASSPNPYWVAKPLDVEEPYEWHFTIRGPADSDFEGGIYHGRIVLPRNYPFGPPSIIMLTPNGRFEVGKKVCLSASNHHPEMWQPAWGLRTMLDALHAFFPTPGEGALHSLDWPREERRKLATLSQNWTCPVCNSSNVVLVEKYCAEPCKERPVLPVQLADSLGTGASRREEPQEDVPGMEEKEGNITPVDGASHMTPMQLAASSSSSSSSSSPVVRNVEALAAEAEAARARRRVDRSQRHYRGMTWSFAFNLFILQPLSIPLGRVLRVPRLDVPSDSIVWFLDWSLLAMAVGFLWFALDLARNPPYLFPS